MRSGGGQLEATPFFSQDNGVTLIRGGTVSYAVLSPSSTPTISPVLPPVQFFSRSVWPLLCIALSSFLPLYPNLSSPFVACHITHAVCPASVLTADPFVPFLMLLQVVNHDKAIVADVLVEDGKIVSIGEDLELPQVKTASLWLFRASHPMSSPVLCFCFRGPLLSTPVISTLCPGVSIPAHTSTGGCRGARYPYIGLLSLHIL